MAYYSNCCTFTEFYTNSELKKYADKKGIPVEIIKISSKKQAHDLPIPWVINSVFYNGKLVTVEMKAEKSLEKLIMHNSIIDRVHNCRENMGRIKADTI